MISPPGFFRASLSQRCLTRPRVRFAEAGDQTKMMHLLCHSRTYSMYLDHLAPWGHAWARALVHSFILPHPSSLIIAG